MSYKRNKIQITHDKFITFIDEPHVHMVGKVGMVHAGEKLHLNCTATGIPKPDISWYRNKKKLQKSKNSRNFALEMKLNDYLIYQCHVQYFFSE